MKQIGHSVDPARHWLAAWTRLSYCVCERWRQNMAPYYALPLRRRDPFDRQEVSTRETWKNEQASYCKQTR